MLSRGQSLALGATFGAELAPDGRRWLGRVLDPGQVPQLKVALGLTDTASAFADGAATASLDVPEGKDATAYYRVKANDVPGGAELAFTVSDGAESVSLA